ncbi:unnamed protein product [Bathycoccus prasinos]
MAPPGVAALRSGRNKGNVSYANDEEGFGGAALSNTTLASEDEEEEDEFDNDEEDEDDEDEEEEEDSESEGEEDEAEEEDSESEGEEDGDDEEEDSGSENKRAKKKQRFAAPNGENNKKRKRAENFGRNGIDNKVLADAKKKADEFNFKVGSGAYVALVVLLAGGAVGITSMNPATIEEFASQLSLEGETKNGKKTKMDYSTIWSAMRADKTNFLRNEDRTYSLAKDLKKKKETMTKKEIESAVEKIDNKVLADAKKKADEFNFKVGSGAYVALVVLLAGGAVGIPSMNPTTIEEFARQLSLEGETKNGKKTKMAHSMIWNAMEADKTNFLRNDDTGTYFLADKLEKKETKEKKKEIESAVEKINDEVLGDAKKKADEFNFKVGSGAYVALVVLLAGGAVGIPSMNPTTIEEFARQLSLEGETKNGKKTKMAYSTIWSAMERDKTNFLRNEDGGTYFLADKLEKKKETKEKKETRGRFNVNRAEWDDTKFPGMHFHKDENKWCPLCNGRTVDRDGSFCHLLFFSLDYLWALTEELLERARGEVKMEDVRDSLHIYFQDKKFHVESGVENFDSFRRHVRHHDGIICHKCLNEAKSELKDQIEGR